MRFYVQPLVRQLFRGQTSIETVVATKRLPFLKTDCKYNSGYCSVFSKATSYWITIRCKNVRTNPLIGP